MFENIYAIRGIIVQTPEFNTIEYHENEYVICENGVSMGIFKELPEEYKDIKVYDCTDKFVIPGMSDIHVHAVWLPRHGHAAGWRF